MNTLKSKHTILCVDDETSVLNSLTRLFRKEDYRILVSDNPLEALKLLESENVSLILSDHRMPEMTGVEFLQNVKRTHPDIIRVILSGYTEVTALEEAINEGHVFKFISKPWEDIDLRTTVQQCLQHYELAQDHKVLQAQIKAQYQELKAIMEERDHALRLSQEILEGLPYPVLGIDEKGEVMLSNEAADTLLGQNNLLRRGTPIEELFEIELQNRIRKSLDKQQAHNTTHLIRNNMHFDVKVIPLHAGLGILVVLTETNL